MKKFLLFSLTVVMVLGLVIGMALPGLANTDKGNGDDAPGYSGRQLYRGEVLDVDYDDYNFTIDDEDETTIQVNEATRFFKINAPGRITEELRTRQRLQEAECLQEQFQEEIKQRLQQDDGLFGAVKGMFQNGKGQGDKDVPGPDEYKGPDEDNGDAKKLQGNFSWLHPFGDTVTFEDLEEGNQVAVFAVPREDDDVPLAKLVFIMEPSEYGRVTGVLTSIDGDEIEIELTSADEDAPDEFYYDEDTVFSLRLQGTYGLEEGMEVSITYTEDDGDYYAKTVTTVGVQATSD